MLVKVPSVILLYSVCDVSAGLSGHRIEPTFFWCGFTNVFETVYVLWQQAFSRLFLKLMNIAYERVLTWSSFSE